MGQGSGSAPDAGVRGGAQTGASHHPHRGAHHVATDDLTIAALAVAGIGAPVAAGAGSDNELRSAPQMRLVDAWEAQLSFTTERPIGRTASGTPKLRIQFVSSSHHVSDVAPPALTATTTATARASRPTPSCASAGSTACASSSPARTP